MKIRYLAGLLLGVVGCRSARQDPGWAILGSPSGKAAVLVREGELRRLGAEGPSPIERLPKGALDDGRIALRDDGAFFYRSQNGRWTRRNPGGEIVPLRDGPRLSCALAIGGDRLVGYVPDHYKEQSPFFGMKESRYRLVVCDLATGRQKPYADAPTLSIGGLALAGQEILGDEEEYEESTVVKYLARYRLGADGAPVLLGRKRWEGNGVVRADGRWWTIVNDGTDNQSGMYGYEIAPVNPDTGRTGSVVTKLGSYVEGIAPAAGGGLWMLHSPGRNEGRVLHRYRNGTLTKVPLSP